MESKDSISTLYCVLQLNIFPGKPDPVTNCSVHNQACQLASTWGVPEPRYGQMVIGAQTNQMIRSLLLHHMFKCQLKLSVQWSMVIG